MIKLKNVINKHKSNKIKENSNTVRHLNNGTDHRHSKSCCDQSSPARGTTTGIWMVNTYIEITKFAFIKLFYGKIFLTGANKVFLNDGHFGG